MKSAPTPRAAHQKAEPARAPARSAPATRGAATDALALARALGNRGYARHLQAELGETGEGLSTGKLPAQEEPVTGEGPKDHSRGALAPDEVAAIPLGGGHEVTARRVDGRLRLGVASDFTTVERMVAALLGDDSLLVKVERDRVRQIAAEVFRAENELDDLEADYREEQEAVAEFRRAVTEPVSGFGPYGTTRNRVNPHHPRYKKYTRARNRESAARQAWLARQESAVAFAKDKIEELWHIGSDFLPTHLMPAGEAFRDRDFTGDRGAYIYHTGANDEDAIPIVWYKAPTDYPRLQLPDGRVVEFGDSFEASGKKFGVAAENRPEIDRKLVKVMHHETREGQKSYNQALVDAGVRVQKGDTFVEPPLGEHHRFDGDHVTDLGFGGADEESNYWPLDSRINRRAFNGYNTRYIVNYFDLHDGKYKSRPIGGLIGKYFGVKAFLAREAGPVPAESGTAEAGGTPR